MKLLAVVALAIAAGAAVYAARRRIKLAIMVAGAVLLVALPIRIAFGGEATRDRVDDLLILVAVGVVLWTALHWLSLYYLRRRGRSG